MLLLGDHFAVTTFAQQVAATGAHLLIRCKDRRGFTTVHVLPDGTRLAR